MSPVTRQLTTLAAVTAVILAPSSRPIAPIATMAILPLVILAVRRRCTTTARAILAVAIATGPAALTIAAFHDVLPWEPPLAVSRLAVVALWACASATIGASVVDRIQGAAAKREALIRSLAALSASAWYATALARQFLPGADLVTRLGFAILEEDNAHVIGVAREVATSGPRGEFLANMYGTGFVVLPHLLLRLFGGPLSSELGDPRQAAITTFVLSSLVVIVLLGSAVWMIATFTSASLEPFGLRRPQPSTLTFLNTLVASWIALAVIIVIPMRTSFLTFVWGIACLALTVAVALIVPRGSGATVQLAVALHTVAALVVLVGSWPFVAAGALPVLIIVIRKADLHWLTSRPLALGILAISALAVLLPLIWSWSRSGLFAEVISYGRELLTLKASAIEADRSAWLVLLVVVSVVAIVAHRRHDSRAIRSSPSGARLATLVIGPPAALVLLYGGLLVAALILTQGELNYAGDKLRYAIISIGLLLAAPAAAALSDRLSRSASVTLLCCLIVGAATSSTIQPSETWWDRSRPQRFPQSELVVATLRESDPGVPIRCLPPPDLEVSPLTRRAAFECVRWVEDAFNTNRGHGHRMTFLFSDDADFGPAVTLALSDEDFYDEVTRLTMRGGWAGLPVEAVKDLPSPWSQDR